MAEFHRGCSMLAPPAPTGSISITKIYNIKKKKSIRLKEPMELIFVPRCQSERCMWMTCQYLSSLWHPVRVWCHSHCLVGGWCNVHDLSSQGSLRLPQAWNIRGQFPCQQGCYGEFSQSFSLSLLWHPAIMTLFQEILIPWEKDYQDDTNNYDLEKEPVALGPLRPSHENFHFHILHLPIL